MELLFLALEVAMRHHPSRLPRLEAKASSSRFPKPESNSGTAPTAATSVGLPRSVLSGNIELGVLIEAGPLPERLSRHLELLIETEIVEPVSAFAGGVP